jgi:hypothetical protein
VPADELVIDKYLGPSLYELLKFFFDNIDKFTDPSQHVHLMTQVTGLIEALAGKAAALHDHEIDEVVGLVQALAGKASADHSHAQYALASAVAEALTAIGTSLAGKQDAGSYAPAVHDHDDRYYTQAEVDQLVAAAVAAVPQPTQFYRVGSFAASEIQGNEILIDHECVNAFTLAANFAGSIVSVGVAPGAAWQAIVQKNGAQVGTISIAANGDVTLTTVGGAAVPFAIDDVLTVIAQATPNTTIARLRVTFRGVIG